MPYEIKDKGEKVQVVNKESGDVKGTFPDTREGRDRAAKQMRLLYAKERSPDTPRKAADGAVVTGPSSNALLAQGYLDLYAQDDSEEK